MSTIFKIISYNLEPVHITTNHQLLEKCTDYSYHGSAVASNAKIEEEICYRVEMPVIHLENCCFDSSMCEA